MQIFCPNCLLIVGRRWSLNVSHHAVIIGVVFGKNLSASKPWSNTSLRKAFTSSSSGQFYFRSPKQNKGCLIRNNYITPLFSISFNLPINSFSRSMPLATISLVDTPFWYKYIINCRFIMGNTVIK